MSETTAVRFENVGKMYKVFPTRRAHLLDAVGIGRVVNRGGRAFREFWALRGIDIDLPRGARLGVIGRNGAGKSTLLKLVTANVPPTEGTVEIRGNVQALLEIGGGLHPEFTGRENIHASLGFYGLDRHEVEEATSEIADFTELGRFLDQPFKTYSLGMQARLSIGIATTVRPEILIIDEILGAGDAYFFSKSTERMRQLIESGATVLLVSHALAQVERFCDEAIWLERGQIAMRGPATEVVKAYERFTRELENRRIRAANRRQVDAFDREAALDELTVRLGAGDAAVSEVALYRDGEVEDRVVVGGPQDSVPGMGAYIDLDRDAWGAPATDPVDGRFFRSAHHAGATARVPVWFFYPTSRYVLAVTYRAAAPVEIHVSTTDRDEQSRLLPPSDHWHTEEILLEQRNNARPTELGTSVSRWSGVGGLSMADVRLVGPAGDEQSVFEVGRPLEVAFNIVADQDGTYPTIPAAILFRADGVVATKHIGELTELKLEAGAQVAARLTLPELLLGNGTYLISLGLYASLDVDDLEPSVLYDYFDKSFEFRVVGNPALHTEIVRHPGRWEVADPEPRNVAFQQQLVRQAKG